MMGTPLERPGVDPVLARMVGEWDVDGRWQVRTDRPALSMGGRMVNRWILDGRFLESDTFPTATASEPSSKVIYGADRRSEDYFAFAVNALHQQYDIEHGPHDPAADSLLLRGVEIVLPSRREIRFLRTIRFVGPDELQLSITYPEESDEDRLGGLTMSLRRRSEGSSDG